MNTTYLKEEREVYKLQDNPDSVELKNHEEDLAIDSLEN
jgi:hypothetical protein